MPTDLPALIPSDPELDRRRLRDDIAIGVAEVTTGQAKPFDADRIIRMGETLRARRLRLAD